VAAVTSPQLSVVVASHDRPIRLRWLLNALAEQTLDRGLWEVVVGHDSKGPETEELLVSHPLTDAGVLRWRQLEPGYGKAGAHRNAALELARAPVVVFTDDDCRPPPDWLEKIVAAVGRYPHAIVQGPVLPDPDEWAMLRSPHPRTQRFTDVPRASAECANIAYPREIVDRVGGFDEMLDTAEDTDLNLRARAAGASYVGDLRTLTYHAVAEGSLLDRIRDARRWEGLPQLLARHPDIRRQYTLGIVWRPSHLWLPVALLGLLRGRRNPRWSMLALPWLSYPFRAANHGTDVRGRLRTVLELPGLAAIDIAEIAVLARGSIRWRSFLL